MQPSPTRRWQSRLYVHGSEPRINHQPGPANKPSGQCGFLLACLSPPASKPSERTLGAAGDEASRFGSGCNHEPWQPLPPQGQPACAWVLHISPPLPRKAPSHIGLSSTSGGFPAKHVGQDVHKQLLRFQIPSVFFPCWILLSYSCCSYRGPTLNCLHLCPSKGHHTLLRCRACFTVCFSGSTAALRQPPRLPNPTGDISASGPVCCLHSPKCHS